MTLKENRDFAGSSSARHPFLDLYLRHHLSMWPAQQMMAADSVMETCTSPEITNSRKRPLDGDIENGKTKKSHHGGGGNTTVYHLKVLIPCVAAGAIIGKGGETIAQLQKDTGARMKMSKANDFYPWSEFLQNLRSNVATSISDLRYEFLKISNQNMNVQGFYKKNEPEFPKSILKKKSQYDQKSKCQTNSISKPVKTIRFTTEIQKKSKFFSSLHSTLLSNKSNKEKKLKKNEKKRNKSDEKKNSKGKVEGKVETLPRQFELIQEETADPQKKNDFNL